MKQYYLDHRSHLIEKAKQYLLANPDVVHARQKNFRENNKEKISTMLKSYYQEHKEEIKQKSKDWAKNNPCKVLAAGRKYKDLNKEKVIEEHRLYRKLHPENKVLSELKRRQLKRSLGEKYFITKDDLAIIHERFNGKCANCSCEEKLTIDHHRPLSRGNPLTLDNAVVLCQSCNARKNNKEPKQFYLPETLAFIEYQLATGAKGAPSSPAPPSPGAPPSNQAGMPQGQGEQQARAAAPQQVQ